MMLRHIPIAAVTLAVLTGTALAAPDGYLYPDPLPRWMPSSHAAGTVATPAPAATTGYLYPDPLPRWMAATNTAGSTDTAAK